MVFFWMVAAKTQMVRMMVAVPQMPIQELLKKLLTMTQKLGPDKPLRLTSMNEDYLKHQQKCNYFYNFEQHKTSVKQMGQL